MNSFRLTSSMSVVSTLRQYKRTLIVSCAVLAGLVFGSPAFSAALGLSQVPLFLTSGQPPLVLLTMARDHKLYYEAYNDYSDLDGDGVLDVGYKPAIEYYGYFDSHKCYNYTSGVFTPASISANKKCAGNWSGDFLNYVTTARIDALRKVLYGGKRSTDTATQTILERTFVPQDAHSWGKEYQSVARDGYDITEYTPLSLPASGRYHLFANTTLTSDTSPPLMRVLTNTNYRVWEWLSIERPVAGTECATGNNTRANCAVAGGTIWEKVPSSYFSSLTQATYSTSPSAGSSSIAASPASKSAFDTFVTTWTFGKTACGSANVSQINGSGNPFKGMNGCRADDDGYLTLFAGSINILTAGTYRFAVDGDDAVDVFIDNAPLVGWYGGHGNDGSDAGLLSHSATISLSAGAHTIAFRHQESTGGDNYYLWWQRVVPTSVMTDYIVRVEVCNSTIGLEANCNAYGASNKPVGVLQRNGESNAMFFGLMTGSYAKNTEGGVMRKAVSTINNEITSDGRFGATTETCKSGTNCVNGIIGTIDKLKITGFNYGSYLYDCGFITTRQMNDGECNAWGNPIGEMAYEGLRYFSGKTTPTADFMYTAAGSIDNALGLPLLTTWTNPYSTSPTPTALPATFSSCSKPYSLLISDVYPSFDSNKVPGTAFGTFSGDITGLNVSTLGQTIWNNETGLGGAKNVFIGQVGTTTDGAPTAKSASSFGNIRGLAPGEPTREGSYYSAAVAYYGHITDLNSIVGDQKLNTYAIALAAPLPKIEIPVGTNKVTIMPFAKSVGGAGISPAATSFQPTNQIVDFYVDAIRNVPGSPTDTNINQGRPYYKFRINYEDSEQGADHDMDAIAIYEIKLNVDNTISIAVTSEYAAGGIIQHMGYAISGTTKDKAYLVVRDTDTAVASDTVYALDCRGASTDPDQCILGSAGTGALPLFKELTFTPNTAADAAVVLKDPLWYAAKWGSFDTTTNIIPGTTDWSANYDPTKDNVPDNYYLVTNPLRLEAQLTKAFAKITDDTGTAAATSTNSFSLQTNSALYQARFSSLGWSGELNAYPITVDGSLGLVSWQAQYKLKDLTSATRTILTYDPTLTTTNKGIPFQWNSMSSTGAQYLRTALNQTYAGGVDSLGSSRVTFLRGDAVVGMRTRPYIKGTTDINKLGDIVNSQPQYTAVPNFGYPEATYAAFRVANKTRTPMVYVGANDGMLHGFNANTGVETLAYVPSEMYRTRSGQPMLSKLTATNYGATLNPHNYYVDGTATVGDVCTIACAASTDWKTILVGGLNGGGQGIYALNINDPSSFSEGNASSIVMWEFNDRNDPDLGYTYSRPAIVRICKNRDNSSSTTPKACNDGQWVVIFGNGYNSSEADTYPSTTGFAYLYVLDALTGTLIKKISTGVGSFGTPNGLATVSPVDVDSDNYVDYVYAGDLLGNMWKFDLTSQTVSNWDSAYKTSGVPTPLYVAKDSATPPNTQKITTAPEAILNPNGGVMVYFGTGSYITTTDPSDSSVQSVYGIWDNNAAVASTDHSNLIKQSVNTSTVVAAGTTQSFRTLSANAVDYATKKGWFIELPQSGERVSFDPRLLGSVLSFTSTIPSADVCEAGGTSWDYFVDSLTGGNLGYSAFLGIDVMSFGGTTAFASSRQSNVGITPPGTIITEGQGVGTDIQSGSTGNTDKYKIDLKKNLASRLSWREILND